MNTKEKYNDIKVSMLPEKTRDTLEKIRRATKDFSIQNDKADKYVSAVHSKLKKEKPQGLRSEDKKPEPKKVEPKKPAAKKPEPKKPEPKKPTKTQTAKVKASLSKLDLAIANDPLLKGLGKTDKTRDAGRRALPAGRRVSKKGWKNQHGKSSGGRVYYENRENRSDRKSPNYKGGYPYLAMGGYTHKGDEGGEFYVNIYTERDGKIVDVQERKYRDKDSAMTFAMMKGNFLNKGQSVFVMDEDGDVIYQRVSMKAKGGYMEHGGKVEKNYVEWEREVTQTLADKLGIDYGDASGIVEAQPFYMQQSWTKGLSAEETADVIDEKSVMAKGGYMAKGGLTEHGLKRGDTINDDLFWENAITVKDKSGKLAKVDLEKGIRKEMMAKGGYMEDGGNIITFAKEDVKLLQEEGSIAITDTKLGVITGEYKNGIFTFRNSQGNKVFEGNKKEAIDFVKNNYQLEQMAEGGQVKGFDALSKKVAARYEGKKVPSKYQSEYGKTYDKEEAKEVGDKVAAKVYRLQLAKKGKMAKGGEIKKGDRVRSTVFKDEEGEVRKKKGDMLLVRKIVNGKFEHNVFRISEVEKLADGGTVKDYKTYVAQYPNGMLYVRVNFSGADRDVMNYTANEENKKRAIGFAKRLAQKNNGTYEGFSNYSLAEGGEVQDYQKISDEVLKFLESKKGREVKVYNEFPNKYGDNTIEYVVKYNIEDKFNYDRQSINIDFTTKTVFIPNQGYFPFKTVKDIKNIINKSAFKRDGIYAKGGKLDQGFNDRLDESLGNLNAKEAKMKATFKARRDESKGENKAVGKRPYSTVKTMDKMEKGGKIKLPYNLKKYFTKPKGTIEVKISELIPNRARKEGIQNAEKYMRQAYDGKMEKRKPITIYKTRNKKYRIKDGNSTFAVAKKHGWDTIFATVEKNPNTTKRAEASVFTIAKRIRKEGEPWKDAVKRAGQMKK